ncbi:MAG: UDP-N-acetylmuramoyl-L-alanyl-D-glutamate--2,6-diaminopimelate ligase [Desulfomonile tiedjei]|nr:UDP-N-acetylmuramoyl-L-alanyl-D-glutamate--2,6-diaminopimelate ligase [Desulfomonile tiedjei]
MSVEVKDILGVLENPSLDGSSSALVSGVTHDSRKILPGWMFVAVPGESSDGHEFIGSAVRAGAVAVVAHTPRPQEFQEIAWIKVSDTRKVLGPIAAMVYGEPTTKMALVGITGTNGKTTVTFLLEAMIEAAGGCPGVVGTITYRWGGSEHTAARTTPEASDLQAMFRDMAEAGVTHAVIEASSHGLHLGRLDGCHFDVAVFTNLSQDHLDYHGNIEDYYLAKRILFNRLLPGSGKRNPTAIVNLDDPFGARLAGEIEGVSVIGFGSSRECAVCPEEINFTADGIRGTVRTARGLLPITSRLAGSFNLLNIMAAIAVAERLEIPEKAIQRGIETVDVVPGRLERVPCPGAGIFVDYAHTPDALKNVLQALQGIRSERIITVMGCGGDRDKTKRPIMGTEAAAGSDFVVVTSDNPRTEEPLEIIAQVVAGVRDYGLKPCVEHLNGRPLEPRCYQVIPDRREAIAWAVKHLETGDILLVAGKGHETYQEINGVRYPFDDREVVREELQKRAATAAAHVQGTSESNTRESLQPGPARRGL